MTDHSARFPRFFVTAEGPCPYLPDRTERKVFAELKGPSAQTMSEALGRIGFRRSQNVVYRPSCTGCAACISVRIVAGAHRPSTSERRLMRRNADLEVNACDPWATEELYGLLRSYLRDRHPNGGMLAMDAYDFAEMIETSPVDTMVVEYREPSRGGRPGRLVGACLTDRQSDGLSMVYSFYDTGPDARSGLGRYIILDHVQRAATVGLDYVYLGYWVDGSERMDYKRRFTPLELLTANGWRPMPARAADEPGNGGAVPDAMAADEAE
jgi:arginine-tRNA-protein transferase